MRTLFALILPALAVLLMASPVQAANTSANAGQACDCNKEFGATQLAANHQDIIACLQYSTAPDDCRWKATTQSPSNCSAQIDACRQAGAGSAACMIGLPSRKSVNWIFAEIVIDPTSGTCTTINGGSGVIVCNAVTGAVFCAGAPYVAPTIDDPSDPNGPGDGGEGE